MISGRPTDHRNLSLPKLHEDVCYGKSEGMIIWQPRIGAFFTDREFKGIPYPGRFAGMTHPEVYRELACSHRLYHFNECYLTVEPESVKFHTETLPGNRFLDVVETPVGSMTQIRRITPNNWYHITEKHWIETPDDMKVSTWRAEHTEWKWDANRYEELLAEWGDIGAATMFMPRVNIQHLYVDVMSVDQAVFAITEWGDVVDDYFKVRHENHMKLIDLIIDSPINIINYGDNLHASTLSPRWYEEYVLPHYVERGQKLHKAGCFISSHWDGDTKPLLKYAKISELDGIEAITPIPQGDVTLEETKEALGDDIFLLDGIPALYFETRYPEEVLIECTERVIKYFAPKLIFGISDEMSSNGDLERIALVGKMVDDYNAQFKYSQK